jgi:Na+/melibiose symporter-like transporter
MKNKLSALLLSFFGFLSTVKSQSSETMASTMRSNGKIYVVVAVLATIVAGLFFYLIRIDKKVSKLEKDL